MTKKNRAASMTFENIHFSYPGVTHETIKNVHIDIKEKEIVVFVGPSGCGKSTLLKISAGLISPQKGRLIIDDEDTIELSPEKRRIGWVPQSYALFEHLSIAENVGFGLKMAKVPKEKREKRVFKMLKLCRIEDLANRSVGDLSGGQRQRVAIARALAMKPRVLLLDEPLAALDPQLRIAIREDLETLLRDSGVTTLFVTHDQSEALALADKVVLLRDGKVEQIGSPEELWNSPVNDFVAEFISNAVTVSAKAVDKNTAEIVPGLLCKLNKNVKTGKSIKLALRKNDLILADEGVSGVITYAEYNGGVYHMKATLDNEVIIPVSSINNIKIGEKVKITANKNKIITVIEK